MAWNTVTEAEVTNLATGEKEIVLLRDWTREHGLSNDACYTASKRGGRYRGYKFKYLRTVTLQSCGIGTPMRNRIVSAYKDGMTIEQLKKEFHYGGKKISEVLCEEGLIVKKPDNPMYIDHEIDDEGKFKALVKAGWLSGNIAIEFCTSVEKVEQKKKELCL